METNFKRNSKKRARETKARSHVAGANKKKKEKEPKMKLSNYEKAVRKFNLNQQLAQGNAENKRITKGPLKIKSIRDGLFLKARRSAIVMKKPLNDANKARKNEDINKIIDIGNEMFGACSKTGKGKKKENILKRLNFAASSSEDEEEDKTAEESDLTVSDSPRYRNRGEGGNAEGIGRQISPRKRLKSRFFNSASSNSSNESFRLKRRKTKGNDETTGRKNSPALAKLEDYLLRQFARFHPNDSKLSGTLPENHMVDLDDFEKFTLRFENALANIDCPLLTGPGVAESALSSLRSLHRKRQETHKGSKMKQKVHFGSKVEFKPKKMYDPVLTWVLNAVPPGESEESPGATSTDPWNAKFDSNIFTFFENPEKPENSDSATSLLQVHDPVLENEVIDIGKVLSPKIRSPSPHYRRRDMF